MSSEYDSVDFETRNFVDDMRDPAIRALALRPYNRKNEYIISLVNKHGRVLSGLNNEEIWAIGRYCQYLIESGAVKANIFPTKENTAPEGAKHVDIVQYYSKMVDDPFVKTTSN